MECNPVLRGPLESCESLQWISVFSLDSVKWPCILRSVAIIFIFYRYQKRMCSVKAETQRVHLTGRVGWLSSFLSKTVESTHNIKDSFNYYHNDINPFNDVCISFFFFFFSWKGLGALHSIRMAVGPPFCPIR